MMLLVLLYRLQAMEKGESSGKEEVETMEDLEAEDEEEDVRLKVCGSSKMLEGVLVSKGGESCREGLVSPKRNENIFYDSRSRIPQ